MIDPSLDQWLWCLTVATAVAGGALSIAGTARQKREREGGSAGRTGYRLVMGSYVLMTVSVLVFAVRGFL